MKKCIKCELELSEDSFSFKNKNKGIRHTACKTCHNEYKKVHYQNNKEKYFLKAKYHDKAYKERNKKTIAEFKSSGCCICGEKDVLVLDCHHIRDKDIDIAIAARSFGPNRLKKELDKCVVVCANDHRRLHAGTITLPVFAD